MIPSCDPTARRRASRTRLADAPRASRLVAGEIDAVTILSRKLIDTHYYAIANKASLSKPVELSPPAAKLADFTTKYGVTWSQVRALPPLSP